MRVPCPTRRAMLCVPVKKKERYTFPVNAGCAGLCALNAEQRLRLCRKRAHVHPHYVCTWPHRRMQASVLLQSIVLLHRCCTAASQNKTVVAITSGANINFERLRLVAELANVGATTGACEICVKSNLPRYSITVRY